MKINSLNNCLNFTDSMILGKIKKDVCIEILEDMRYYLIWIYNNKYDGEMLALLSHINIMKENIYLNDECAFNPLYHDLRIAY